MTTGPSACVVVFVADVERVSAFYKAVASMKFVSGGDDHAVLSIDGFELVIHKLRGEPEPIRDSAGRVRVREDSYSKLCLPVQSIAIARAAAEALGGFIKSPDYEWQTRGFRACDGHDPEGNVIQLRAGSER